MSVCEYIDVKLWTPLYEFAFPLGTQCPVFIMKHSSHHPGLYKRYDKMNRFIIAYHLSTTNVSSILRHHSNKVRFLATIYA